MKRGIQPVPAFGPELVIGEGVRFATDFEVGCVAQGAPDVTGHFDGLDSDGVECLFWTGMVRGHRNYRPAP